MEVYINYVVFGLSIVFMIAAPLSILALRLREGFWGNAVCLCNVTFAGLIALDYFEPLSALIADAWAGGIFFMDLLIFWVLFTISYFIVNCITNRLSRIKVHFPKVVEQVGNFVMLAAIVFNFFSLVGFSYPVSPMRPTASQNLGREQTCAEAFALRAGILSEGSLAAFTGTRPLTPTKRYVDAYNNKRWLLYHNRFEEKGFLYGGEVPSKRN